MKDSMFYRYFLRISAVILASFLILGAILFAFIWKYSADEKQKLLLNTAGRVATLTTAFFDAINGVYGRQFRNSVSFFAENIGSDIYICDTEGKIFAYAFSNNENKRDNQNQIDKKIPKSVLKIVTEKGEYKETGKMNGFLNDTCYIVALPFGLSDESVGGAVVMVSSANALTTFMLDYLQMLVIAMILALFVAYIWLYFATKKMIEPLKQMSLAANNFANGKFDERIKVNGKDEIAKLSLSFNNMAKSLSLLEDMRSGFVSDVSHELKTPMTTIGGFIDGILDGTIEKEKQGYYLNIVSNEIKRLSRLVNSLLDIARINSGKLSLNLSDFDVSALLLSVADNLELSAKEKEITFNFEFGKGRLIANADYDAIYRVVYNLCENAIKFSYLKSVITLKAITDDKKIYISIKNIGEGIDKEDIPFVFDRFYKSDKSRGLDTKGVGLGLYMCNQIIKLHGESIWAVSQKGEYTEFVFTLKTAN